MSNSTSPLSVWKVIRFVLYTIKVHNINVLAVKVKCKNSEKGKKIVSLHAEEYFLIEMPHMIGLPIMPSNLIVKPSSPLTKAFSSGMTRGLFAPTRAKISKQ